MKGRGSFFIRGRFMVFAFLVIISVSGCCILPLPEHGLLAGRGKIDKEDIAFLKVGVTTQEDVVLRFGEPDIVLFEERILAYYWAVSVGVIVVQHGGGDVRRDHIFMLEFDNKGRLKRAEINASGWVGGLTRLKKWIKESEDETISSKSRQ